MKILIVCHYFRPHPGGIEVVVENQAKALAEAGQTVHIVTSACGAKPGAQQLEEYGIRRVPAWNYFEDRMGAVFPIFSPSLLMHTYKGVKCTDVVHAHDAFYLSSLAVAFWTRMLGKPLILTQHVDMVPHPKKVVNFVQKVVYATTGKFIWSSSSKIIVLNSRVRDFLIHKGVDPSKIVFLPNGVDIEAFSPVNQKQKQTMRKKYTLPKDKVLALFVGRFVPKKGFTKLLQLAPIENLDIVFAGGYAPSGHSRPDHHFLGPVSRTDAPDVFRMCDIFILPSEGEGFPVTVQEAMATGLPVVTTDDPAYEMYNFDRKHIILIERTTRYIAKALQTLSCDAPARLRMSRYSRAYATNNIAWNVHIEKLLTMYKELLA